MSDPIRSRIRDDILSRYEEPTPDLTRRAFALVAARQPQRRSTFQVLTITAALLLLALAVLVARGTHLLSLSQEASRGQSLRPPVAPYSIVGNQFVSATTGWILINEMQTTAGPLVLLRTSDGGKHWVEQFRYTGQGGLKTLHFSRNGLDGTMSFAEGGFSFGTGPFSPNAPPNPTGEQEVVKIYETHDGGAHWQLAFEQVQNSVPSNSEPAPAYYPAVMSPTTFLDNDREGWQLRRPAGLPLGRDPLVMHSTDGGQTWEQVGVVSKYNDPLPGGISVSQLTFSDSQNGWLWASEVGDPSQAGGMPQAFDDQGNPRATVTSSPLIYATHDGGHTWAAATLELPRGRNNANRALLFNAPVMLDAAHGFLVLYVEDSGGPAYTVYILRTADGGNHWGALQGVPNGMSGSGVFLTESHWVAPDGSFLKETTDGGKTWSSRRVLVDGMTLASGSPGNGLYYIAPATIWAQVREGHALIRSTDAGRTWEAVTLPTVH